jgi:putative transposase
MSGKARKVVITERQQEVLVSLVRSSTSPQRLVTRGEIILLAFEGKLNQEIAQQVSLNPDQVGTWRRRWQEAFDRLVAIECQEGTKALRIAIEDLLSDAPRSGGPVTFTAEQITQILAVACEPPEDSGRPVTHWTPKELADEVQKRGIVTSISVRQVGRFLKSGRSQTASQSVLVECESESSGPRAVPA